MLHIPLPPPASIAFLDHIKTNRVPKHVFSVQQENFLVPARQPTVRTPQLDTIQHQGSPLPFSACLEVTPIYLHSRSAHCVSQASTR
jgi:hypothetical protein